MGCETGRRSVVVGSQGGGGGGQDVGPWNGYEWILRETNFPEPP